MGWFKRKKIDIDIHLDKFGNIIRCSSDSNLDINVHLTEGQDDWCVIGANRRVFRIPVGNLSKSDAEKAIAQLMNKYTGNINFNNIHFPHK